MAKNIFGNRPGLENMNLGITECTPVNLEMSLIDENPKNEKIFNMSKIDDLQICYPLMTGKGILSANISLSERKWSLRNYCRTS